jgi:hypothetical protein
MNAGRDDDPSEPRPFEQDLDRNAERGDGDKYDRDAEGRAVPKKSEGLRNDR